LIKAVIWLASFVWRAVFIGLEPNDR